MQHRDFDAEESKYLRKLSVVFDLERFITELERSSAGPKALIPLKYEMAVTFGLIKVHPPSPINPSPPLMLDDSIMDYKYIYDSAMPNCFESSIKKLRCLLRFYILVITPNAPLLEETWKAMRLMELVATEEDLLGRIKNALSEC